MTRDCPVCGRALERSPRRAGEVVRGAVSAIVEGAPVLACPQGHHTEELRSDLADILIAEVRDQLLVSRRSRFRGRHRCGACAAELTIPGRRTVRSVSRSVADVGVVRVTFDLPMLRCPGCGLEQLPAEVAERDLEAAVSGALGPGSPDPP